MKKLATVVFAAAITAAMTVNAMAATVDWRWIDTNSDSDMECYAYNENGDLYTSTTTPDGYTVNEAGAWTVNGVVQEKSVFGAQGIGWKQSSNPEHLGQWWYATNNAMTTWYAASSEDAPLWQWIGGYCYAFDQAGWMFQSTTTPDGYTVNDQGQWTVNGAVQYRAGSTNTFSGSSSGGSSSGGSSSGGGSSTTTKKDSYTDASNLNSTAAKDTVAKAAESHNVTGVSVSSTAPAQATQAVTVTITGNSTASTTSSDLVAAVDASMSAANVVKDDTSVKSIAFFGKSYTTYGAALSAAQTAATAHPTFKKGQVYSVHVEYTDNSSADINFTVD